jgi:membrane protein required for colicin V production
VGALINNVFSNLAQATGLSGTDQLFGMVFGLIRGGMVVIILVSLLSISPVSQDIWWRESQLIPHFLLLEEWFYKLINDPQEINSMLELIQLQR